MRQSVNTCTRGGASEAPRQQALRRVPTNIVQRYAEKTLKNSAQLGAVRPIKSLNTFQRNVNVLRRTAIFQAWFKYAEKEATVRWRDSEEIFLAMACSSFDCPSMPSS